MIEPIIKPAPGIPDAPKTSAGGKSFNLWLEDTHRECVEREYRITPVFKTGKTKPYSNNQSYDAVESYKNAVAIGVCLDDYILVD